MTTLKEHLATLSLERQDRIRQRANYLILEEKYLRAKKELKSLRKTHSDLIAEFWQLKYDNKVLIDQSTLGKFKHHHLVPGSPYCNDLNCLECR